MALVARLVVVLVIFCWRNIYKDSYELLAAFMGPEEEEEEEEKQEEEIKFEEGEFSEEI